MVAGVATYEVERSSFMTTRRLTKPKDKEEVDFVGRLAKRLDYYLLFVTYLQRTEIVRRVEVNEWDLVIFR